MAPPSGVVNPNGLYMAAVSPLFLAAVPLTTLITRPNSILQSLTTGLIRLIPSATTSTTRTIGLHSAIPALSAFYIFVSFAATGAASAAGVAAATKGSYDNNHPRAHISELTGLPLRLRSAHYNIIEMFPGYALSAALAYASIVAGGASAAVSGEAQQLVNLLGLHVILKTFVYYPAYLADIAPLRSLAHFGATAAVINVAWRVARGLF